MGCLPSGFKTPDAFHVYAHGSVAGQCQQRKLLAVRQVEMKAEGWRKNGLAIVSRLQGQGMRCGAGLLPQQMPHGDMRCGEPATVLIRTERRSTTAFRKVQARFIRCRYIQIDLPDDHASQT